MKTSLELTVRGSQIDQTVEQTMTVTARRPNQLVLKIERGMLGGTATTDGKTLYTYFPDQKAYLKEKAPADFGDLTETPTLIMLYSQSIGPPVLLNLLHPNPYKALTGNLSSATYEGAEKVNGHPCHHLALSQQRYDWEAWIRKSDKAILQKVRVDLTRLYRKSSRGNDALKGIKAHSVMKLTEWKPEPNLSKDAFAFAPPKKAKEYGSVAEMIRGEMKSGKSSSRSDLVGKKAPNFTAPKLDGSKVTLSDHRGSDVVVLDFWATWCPPCKKAMPKLDAVNEKYSDKAVAVYAVNVEEKAGKKKLKRFMKDRNLGLTVLMDRKGISQDYGVRGIPQTVVIGKKGRIQAVHTGFDPRMKQTLSSQIDRLLAGKNLVEPKN
jgi:peroxiredoxin